MSDAAEIRRWARNKGLEVGDRGRLAPDLVAAYELAQQAVPRHRAKTPTVKKPAVRVMPRTVKAKEHWDWQRREATSR